MDNSIESNLFEIRKTIPNSVKLVAVSKFHPAASITEAYNIGQRVFGESKVQELTAKQEVLPKDIEWHFIGHLQSNKVKFITPFISLIHSVDSLKLLEEINKCAKKDNRIIDVLLQIHIAKEQTKFGFSPKECIRTLNSISLSDFSNIRIVGLMGMATFTDDENEIRREFKTLTSLFNELKGTIFSTSADFKELSFGMSDDYLIAIEEGSTMVRVGSKIFGERNYQ
ncbi:MAG: YggS family pyridoxal phosphate-dependent enzyme [Bacteroidales bacterium]|nr:YggS family pyridoxal phosphate-dependent enzyme [Bacteroidales bacterium]